MENSDSMDKYVRKFILQSRPTTYQTGVTSDHKQVIMGMHLYPWIVALFFDNDGTFLEVQRRELGLTQHPNDWYDPNFQNALRDALRSWQRTIGFVEKPISIKLFFQDSLRIGIKEFPSDLQDYIDNPHKYPESDSEEFAKDIVDWQVKGNYVFWWNTSYHLDKTGDTL